MNLESQENSKSKRTIKTAFQRNNSAYGKNVTRINIELEECIFTYDINSYSELRVLKKMMQTSLKIKRSILRLFKNDEEITGSDNIRINELFPNEGPVIDLKCLLGPTSKKVITTSIKVQNLCETHKKYSIIYCFTCAKSICNACLYENQEHYGHIYSDKMDYCRDSRILVEEMFKEITDLNYSIEPIEEEKFTKLSNLSNNYFDSLSDLVERMKHKTQNFISGFSSNAKISRDNINNNLEFLKETCVDGLEKLKERLIAKRITYDDEVFLEFYQRYNEIKNEEEIIKSDKKNLENLKNYFGLITENIEMFLEKLNTFVFDQEKDFTSHLDAVENSTVKVNEIDDESLNRIQRNILRNVKDGHFNTEENEKVRKSVLEKSNLFSFNDSVNNDYNNTSKIPNLFKNNRDGLYRRSVSNNKELFENNVKFSQVNSKRFIQINDISDFDEENNENKFIELPGQTKILKFFPEIKSKEKHFDIKFSQQEKQNENEEKNPFIEINDIETQYRTQQILNDINEIKQRRSIISQRRDALQYEDPLNINEILKEENKITENPNLTQNQQDLDANVNANNISVDISEKYLSPNSGKKQEENLDFPQSQIKNNEEVTRISVQEITSRKSNIANHNLNSEENDYSEIFNNENIQSEPAKDEEIPEKIFSQTTRKSQNFDEEENFDQKLNTQNNMKSKFDLEKSSYEDFGSKNLSNSKMLSSLLEDPLSESMSKKYGELFTNSKNYNVIFAPIKNTRKVNLFYQLIENKIENQHINTQNSSKNSMTDDYNTKYFNLQTIKLKENSSQVEKNTDFKKNEGKLNEIEIKFSHKFCKVKTKSKNKKSYDGEFFDGAAFLNKLNSNQTLTRYYIYVSGGYDPQNKTESNRFFLVDLTNRRTEPLPEMLENRTNHSMIHDNGFIYVVGGKGKTSCEKYDINKRKWNTMPNISSLKNSLSEFKNPNLFCHSSYLYSFFGKNNNEYINCVVRLNIKITKSTWEYLPLNNPDRIDISRIFCGFYRGNCDTFKSKVLIFGGESNQKINSDVFEFDFKDNTFKNTDHKLNKGSLFKECLFNKMDNGECLVFNNEDFDSLLKIE